MKLEEIKRSLAGLTNAELDELSSAISALRQFGGGPAKQKPKQANETVAMLAGAIFTYLDLIGCPVPSYLIWDLAKGEGYYEKIKVLDKYLDGLTKQEKLIVIQKGVELVVKSLQQLNVPVSPRAIHNNIHRIPSLINQEFPGYAQSGYLRMLLKKENP